MAIPLSLSLTLTLVLPTQSCRMEAGPRNQANPRPSKATSSSSSSSSPSSSTRYRWQPRSSKEDASCSSPSPRPPPEAVPHSSPLGAKVGSSAPCSSAVELQGAPHLAAASGHDIDDAKEAVPEEIAGVSVEVEALSPKLMAGEGRQSKTMESATRVQLKHHSPKGSGCYKWQPRPKDTANKCASQLAKISHEIPVESPIEASKKNPPPEAPSKPDHIIKDSPSKAVKKFREIPISISYPKEAEKEISQLDICQDKKFLEIPISVVSPKEATEEVSLEDTCQDIKEQEIPISIISTKEAAVENLPEDTSQDKKSEEVTTSVTVDDARLIKSVFGKGRKTKERIEKETATKITVPAIKKVKLGSFIVVQGPSQENVDEAVSKVKAVLHEAEEHSSLGYSHFISLPLALHSALRDHVTLFHDSVLSLIADKRNQDSVGHSDVCSEVAGISKRMKINIPVTDASENIIPFKELDHTQSVYLNDLNRKTEEGTIVSAEKQEGTCDTDSIQVIPVDTVEVGEPAVCNTEATIKKQNDQADLRTEEKTDIVETDEADTTVEEADDETDLDAVETDELDVCETVLEEKKDEARSVLKENRGHEIEESIFIRATRLHLTVLMLKLGNEERVTAAAEVLQDVKSKLYETLSNRPISIRLKGLECMKGSPEKARVLYASVEESQEKERLIQACNIIRDAYVAAGFVSQKDQNQELKLHLTLMNTSHMKRRKGKRSGKQRSFDARGIISKHGSEDWGEHMIVEAQLSQRFKYDEDDYYHCCSTLQFPAP